MIIYNITTKVHASVDEAWLKWLKEEHIPAILASGCLTGYTIARLLEQDDSEGNTYAVQYTAPDEKNYLQFIHTHAPILRKKATEKWGEHTISFHSALEVIQ